MVGCALVPATSGAAVAEIKEPPPCNPPPGLDCPGSPLEFRADAGEANVISVEYDDTGSGVIVRDLGAPLRAGRGCEAIDSHAVRCLALGTTIDSGDGDDRIIRSDSVFRVTLGAGADRMEHSVEYVYGGGGDDYLLGSDIDGGEGADTLIGTPQEDSLSGDAGPDTMIGGDGDDYLEGSDLRDGSDYVNRAPVGEQPSNDVLDGGAGTDTALYAGRREGIVVDLADPAPDGTGDERDTLSSIEGVYGGKSDDRIVGDAGPNRLFGAGGSDAISGGDGPDEVVGAGGHDRLDGGAGPDRMDSSGRNPGFRGPVTFGEDLERDLLHESVSCGAGNDVVEDSHRDLVLADCERIDQYFQVSYPRAAGRYVTFSTVCPSFRGAPGRCRVRMSLRVASRACAQGAKRTRRATRSFRGRRRASLRIPLPRGCRHGRVSVGFNPGSKHLRFRFVADTRRPRG